MTGVAAAGAANAAVAGANAVAAPTQPRAFEEKDSYDTWVWRWEIFITLSTIDEVLDAGLHPAYKPTCYGLLADHDQISRMLRTRCNAGKNRHIWRHQMALCTQRPNQQADNWLCELRDISRKCNFIGDCCARCEVTRILGQVVTGVADNEVRIKLLGQGDTLTLARVGSRRKCVISYMRLVHGWKNIGMWFFKNQLKSILGHS
ncbi:hypothetical protein OUZ56_011575 [Daphnia magna]|uniref:Uncharacterized protein n=1 Tax=Daphnia magna TaxID=35525 RepID=A0ABQ9Z0I7_9CRUS|nr:hypothetical protein OUZ56_011575 [Daphnia magna]